MDIFNKLEIVTVKFHLPKSFSFPILHSGNHSWSCCLLVQHIVGNNIMYNMHAKSLQSCLTLCDPMDCSQPDSCVHGILWVRILEWIAISYSRGSSQPKDWTHVSCVSCIGRQILYYCTTWEALLKWEMPKAGNSAGTRNGRKQEFYFGQIKREPLLKHWSGNVR